MRYMITKITNQGVTIKSFEKVNINQYYRDKQTLSFSLRDWCNRILSNSILMRYAVANMF